MTKVLILNGPNLNMLGKREVRYYGTETLKDIEMACINRAKMLEMEISFFQTNCEAELIEKVQDSQKVLQGIILNAAAFTHTSLALADAVSSITLPVIEVHISNIYNREPFRNHSYLSPVVAGIVCGFGAASYLIALDAMAQLLSNGS